MIVAMTCTSRGYRTTPSRSSATFSVLAEKLASLSNVCLIDLFICPVTKHLRGSLQNESAASLLPFFSRRGRDAMSHTLSLELCIERSAINFDDMLVATCCGSIH